MMMSLETQYHSRAVLQTAERTHLAVGPPAALPPAARKERNSIELTSYLQQAGRAQHTHSTLRINVARCMGEHHSFYNVTSLSHVLLTSC
jgi:hypothetical protein